MRNMIKKNRFSRYLSLYFVIIGLYTTLFLGCTGDKMVNPGDNKEPVDLSLGWTTATPASQGINAEQLAGAYDHARQINVSNVFLKSLLVVRNSRLVAEEYFGNNRSSQLYDVRSVTKSVISTLVGIALREGFIDSVDQKMVEFIDHLADDIDEEKGKITIRHLLTMTSGFQWNEIGGPEYGRWFRSLDQINYLTNKPLSNPPGQQFNYNSAAVHLLSVILTESTGMSTIDFADQYLFNPLGISERGWQTVSRGYYNGGAGLALQSRDVAKLGVLFLQQGFSGDREIVPQEWVADATKIHQTMGYSYGPLKKINYGYLWWIDSGQEHDMFLAWGYGGQFIYCVPELDLVVVTTSERNVSQATANQQEIAVLDLIVNYILPAVE